MYPVCQAPAPVETWTREVEVEVEQVFRVPEVNIDRLNAAFARIAKRAERLGCVPPAYEVVGHRDEPEIIADTDLDPTGQLRERVWTGRIVRIIFLVVTGQAPKFNGWSLIAVIDHTTDSEIGNLVRAVPGEESIPVAYRTAAPTCDHCQKSRRRNETFVVRHDDGRLVRVGRNCLADFLGHKSPEALAAQCEWLAEIRSICEAAEEYSGGGQKRYSLRSFLCVVAAVIRLCGWRSRTEARESYDGASASADVALTVLNTPASYLTAEDKLILFPPDEDAAKDAAKVDAAIAWVEDDLKARDRDGLSDYLYNLLVVCSQSSIENKGTGLAASLLQAHARHLDRELERARDLEKRSKAPSQYVGQVKERLSLVLTCTGVLGPYENQWGTSYGIKLEDTTGNRFLWWTGSEAFKLGETRSVKATVKAHEEYRGQDRKTGLPWEHGIRQTILTRVAEEKAKAPRKARSSK